LKIAIYLDIFHHHMNNNINYKEIKVGVALPDSLGTQARKALTFILSQVILTLQDANTSTLYRFDARPKVDANLSLVIKRRRTQPMIQTEIPEAVIEKDATSYEIFLTAALTNGLILRRLQTDIEDALSITLATSDILKNLAPALVDQTQPKRGKNREVSSTVRILLETITIKLNTILDPNIATYQESNNLNPEQIATTLKSLGFLYILGAAAGKYTLTLTANQLHKEGAEAVQTSFIIPERGNQSTGNKDRDAQEVLSDIDEDEIPTLIGLFVEGETSASLQDIAREIYRLRGNDYNSFKFSIAPQD
jgi:hypothetical protein